MTDKTQQIEELLARKRQIDTTQEGRYTSTQRWLCDAVELLLRLEKQK